MVDYELSIIIKRPVAEVFEYITNPENIPEWATYIQEAVPIPDGPIGVGSQIRQKVRRREVIWEVTAFEPDTLCIYEADYWYASNAQVTFRVEAVEDGTKFTVHDKGQRTSVMRLLAPILDWNDKRVRKQQLAAIKEILERN